jgi:hypothetical protein
MVISPVSRSMMRMHSFGLAFLTRPLKKLSVGLGLKTKARFYSLYDGLTRANFSPRYCLGKSIQSTSESRTVRYFKWSFSRHNLCPVFKW